MKKFLRRCKIVIDHVMLSMREARICWEIAEGCESFSLKTDSITDSSVEVVSCGSARIKDQGSRINHQR